MRISDWSSDVCSSDLSSLLPPLRRQGRVGEGCLWDHIEPWAPPPSLPLPSQGEGPKQEIAAEAAPTRRCRRASLGVRNVQTRGVNTRHVQPVFSFETPFTCTLPPFIFSGPGLPMKASPRLFAAFAAIFAFLLPLAALRSEEHTSELQSLMRISYAVFCLK